MSNEFKSVEITGGTYEGERGWVKTSDKPRGGRLCVMFTGVNLRGAFVEVENIKDTTGE